MSGDRIALPWSEIRQYMDAVRQLPLYDADGVGWRQNALPFGWRRQLLKAGDDETYWNPLPEDLIWIDPPPIPEPPDGTRIEFEHHTDVYAAWRDDDCSAYAGYPPGQGWCMFGSTVPRSWTIMWLEFGESLILAVRLVPHPDDVGNYALWPTSQYRAAGGTVD